MIDHNLNKQEFNDTECYSKVNNDAENFIESYEQYTDYNLQITRFYNTKLRTNIQRREFQP